MPKGEISMQFNCCGVPTASRGFSAAGKRISRPLSIRITTHPATYAAEEALSVKVLMPLLDYRLFIHFRKRLRLRQLRDFQPTRLAQFDLGLDLEHCFTAAVADMDVNWPMFVACKTRIYTRPSQRPMAFLGSMTKWLADFNTRLASSDWRPTCRWRW